MSDSASDELVLEHRLYVLCTVCVDSIRKSWFMQMI